jgi:hypothetical protein
LRWLNLLEQFNFPDADKIVTMLSKLAAFLIL